MAGKALLADKAPPTPEAARAADQARIHALHQAGKRGRTVGTGLGKGTRNLHRGTRSFGRAVWNPFAVAAGVLWLEVAGLFFALFELFFVQHLYELRHAWRGGPDHRRFLLYLALCLLFAYFAGSSFARARQKQRRGVR